MSLGQTVVLSNRALMTSLEIYLVSDLKSERQTNIGFEDFRGILSKSSPRQHDRWRMVSDNSSAMQSLIEP